MNVFIALKGTHFSFLLINFIFVPCVIIIYYMYIFSIFSSDSESSEDEETKELVERKRQLEEEKRRLNDERQRKRRLREQKKLQLKAEVESLENQVAELTVRGNLCLVNYKTSTYITDVLICS